MAGGQAAWGIPGRSPLVLIGLTIIRVIIFFRMTDLAEYLPLKPISFQILLVLSEGERHGYGIVKEIHERTDGDVRLEPGNLYRYIRRLMEDGMVAESAKRPAPESDDERRRYYRVTSLGRRVFAAEVERMKGLVRAAERTVRSASR